MTTLFEDLLRHIYIPKVREMYPDATTAELLGFVAALLEERERGPIAPGRAEKLREQHLGLYIPIEIGPVRKEGEF